MSWRFSENLYHKSVQSYDKSVDMLKWMQIGLRAPGGRFSTAERETSSVSQVWIFPEKVKKVAEVVAIELSFL